MPAMSLTCRCARQGSKSDMPNNIFKKAKMFDSGKDCHSTLDSKVEDDVEGKEFCHTQCENPGISPSSV